MPLSWNLPTHSFIALLVLSLTRLPATAGDNELTAEEEQAGWQLLFDGESLAGWKNNNDKPVAEGCVQAGTINTHGCGGYLLVYDQPFGDFEFTCDVKMTATGECNSGVFFRVSDLADPVMTGLEIQVYSPPGTELHDFGAIYDLVPPSKDVTNGPGQWNTLAISCTGPRVKVSVNGQQVAEMICDDFSDPGKRPDGTEHKFRRAIKDFARSGYLGLQDHGSDVWYKNIKLREIHSLQ